MEDKNKKNKKEESVENEQTVIYKPVKKKRKKKKHPKLRLFLKIMFITILLMMVIGGGILAAILYRCIWGDWAINEKDLAINYQNSTLYDINGEVIANLSNTAENRVIISKDEMSPYIFKAFISIEDERFEQHNGVDWKRTAGAIFTFATHKGESSYGGSTITQQLVKNLTGEDENSAFEGALRKIKEIVRAYQVEQILSKDQILELYVNLIPLGGGGKNLYGVQTASKYYFDKDAKDLTLVEAAYLAGITNAPSTYNPFGETDRSARIKKRVTNVLWKMHELGKIDDSEYQAALAEVEAGIKFTQGSVTQNNNLTYHAEAAIKEILKDLMEENGWDKEIAELHLYGSGYQIYTTYDPEVQKSIDEQYVNNASKWTSKYKTVTRKKSDGTEIKEEVRIESAIAIMDHTKGYVVAGTSGFGEKTTAWGTNRITSVRHSPGSCIKPIAVVGPSLQEGLITAATVIDDSPVAFGTYKPRNYDYGFLGLMNIRWILRVSRNIPQVKMMKDLTVAKSLTYLAKLGLDTSTEKEDGLSLALGGMSQGPTVLEMTAAYATIANYGEYIEPTFYKKVTDIDGNEILGEEHQEKRRVFSTQNAWILQSLLEEPIGTGLTGANGATGPMAKVKNQATAGKTGTTNERKAVWFCGFTPYYTGAAWMGYDIEGDGSAGPSTTVARLWGTVMSSVHAGKATKNFERPAGITTALVCSKSGLIASEICKNAGYAYNEFFADGTVPKDTCASHTKTVICKKTGKLASENCTETEEQFFTSKEEIPKETCTECKPKPNENTVNSNTINTNTTTNNTNTSKPNNTVTPNPGKPSKPNTGNTVNKGNTVH